MHAFTCGALSVVLFVILMSVFLTRHTDDLKVKEKVDHCTLRVRPGGVLRHAVRDRGRSEVGLSVALIEPSSIVSGMATAGGIRISVANNSGLRR